MTACKTTGQGLRDETVIRSLSLDLTEYFLAVLEEYTFCHLDKENIFLVIF